MDIIGRYSLEGFGSTYVYKDNKMYVLERPLPEVGETEDGRRVYWYNRYSVFKVGEWAASGILTKEVYDKWESECTHYGLKVIGCDKVTSDEYKRVRKINILNGVIDRAKEAIEEYLNNRKRLCIELCHLAMVNMDAEMEWIGDGNYDGVIDIALNKLGMGDDYARLF